MTWSASALRVNTVGLHHCAPDWSWAPEGMRDFDYWAVLDGTGTIDDGVRVRPLARGVVCFFSPKSACACAHDPAHPLVVIAAHYDYLDARGRVSVPRRTCWPPFYRQASAFDFVERISTRMVDAWQRGGAGKAAVWLAAILEEMNAQERASVAPAGMRATQARAIDAICNRIRQAPEKRYALPDLARELHCTPRHFSRLFRRRAGVSPREFLLRARLEAGKSLLRFSDHSVTRIAELAGFTDVYYFSRIFRKCTGLPPTAWRRMNVHKGAV